MVSSQEQCQLFFCESPSSLLLMQFKEHLKGSAIFLMLTDRILVLQPGGTMYGMSFLTGQAMMDNSLNRRMRVVN